MSYAENDIAEFVWLVEHDMSFVGHLSSGQCKVVHDLSSRCRMRRDVVYDLMSCVNIPIGKSLYDVIWFLAGMRSYADSLAT